MKVIIITALLFIGITPLFSQKTFTLTSEDVGGQAGSAQFFNGFGCTGENASPQLQWANVPEDTRSFAVTMYDKDAPTGSGWWHWVVFDLPAGTLEIPANAGNITSGLMPEYAIQSRTDFGSYGYGGPCPPEGHGFHEYLITVYALDTDKLELDRDATPALVGYMINAHLLGKASIVIYAKR
ncbi:MAG: YbhB/YbcL family Raf kinase inhibitor-like protein [Saprospiraceae bacterium]|nr:YbhB/YbcL family Raf kinase inhibitor-like protein [Lewinella sp.]